MSAELAARMAERLAAVRRRRDAREAARAAVQGYTLEEQLGALLEAAVAVHWELRGELDLDPEDLADEQRIEREISPPAPPEVPGSPDEAEVVEPDEWRPRSKPDRRGQIVAALETGPKTIKELVAITGGSEASVRACAWALDQLGKVRKVIRDGKVAYELPRIAPAQCSNEGATQKPREVEAQGSLHV